MWKRFIPLVVIVVVIGGGMQLYKYRHLLLRPNFARLGGTLLVCAREEEEAAPDQERLEEWAAILAQRFDPKGMLGIRVEATEAGRIEIRVPRTQDHDERVEQIQRLLGRRGKLELIVVARGNADQAGVQAARAALAEKGSALVDPPPPPRLRASKPKVATLISGEKEPRYAWVRMSPAMVKQLMLDDASLRHSNPGELQRVNEAIRTGQGFSPSQASEMMVVARRPDPAKDTIYYGLVRAEAEGEGIGNEAIARIWVDRPRHHPHALVVVRFTREGGERLFSQTSQMFAAGYGHDPNRKLGFVVDGEMLVGLNVNTPVRGELHLDGMFTGQEAEDLAALLRAPALMVPLRVVEERAISPR